MSKASAGARSPVRPVATNDRATVLVGCVVWAVLLVACLVWEGRLADSGREWWLWTCVAGLVLGLAGLAFLHHRAVTAQRRPDAPATAPPAPAPPAPAPPASAPPAPSRRRPIP